MADDVSRAWFDAADKARNAMLREDPNDQIGDLIAAIAAVAPLIRADERDACAKVADGDVRMAEMIQGFSAFAKALRGEEIAIERADACRRIAAAIRARGAP